jgi:hypothetical protein
MKVLPHAFQKDEKWPKGFLFFLSLTHQSSIFFFFFFSLTSPSLICSPQILHPPVVLIEINKPASKAK